MIEEKLKGKADLHVHPFDPANPENYKVVMDHVELETDLDVIAITEHNSVIYSLKALTYAREKNYKIDVITGSEINSLDGHIIGLNIDRDVPAGLTAEETVNRIHELGGIAIAAHPEAPQIITRLIKKYKALNEKLLTSGVDAVEVLNGTPFLYWKNKKLQKDLAKHKMPKVAGSDAHTIEAIRSCYTAFKGKTKQDFFKSLKIGEISIAGNVWNKKQTLKHLEFMLKEKGVDEKLRNKILKKFQRQKESPQTGEKSEIVQSTIADNKDSEVS